METIAVLIPCYNKAPTVQKGVRNYPDICVCGSSSAGGTDRPAAGTGAVVRRGYRQGNVPLSMVIKKQSQIIELLMDLSGRGDGNEP